jgi:hypothetical protein
MDEGVLGAGGQPLEVPRIARVGQLVQVDERTAAGLKPRTDEVAADESGAAGEEDVHGRSLE